MRGEDIRPVGELWLYTPREWKTMHHPDLPPRQIWIGPKLQVILQPFLDECPPGAYLFRPAEHARQKARGFVKPNERYTTASYDNSIRRVCERLDRDARAKAIETGMSVEEAETKVFFPRWHPNQLRHTFATAVRQKTWGADKKPGVEAAKVLLGHSNLDMTQVYAEDDEELAREVILEIG